MENQNCYTFEIEYPMLTAKEVRKLGKDFGYGVTMGVFSAIFTINVGIGIAKAIKRRLDKKVETGEKKMGTVEFKEDKEGIDEE